MNHFVCASHRMRRWSERGFTLIELLIAAFIMAVGLLGLAALQVASQSQGTGSRLRGTATFVAHNLLDQIQAEGSVSSSQRIEFGTLTMPAVAFTYIGTADASSKASTAGPGYTIIGLLPDDRYYIANPTAPQNIIFNTTWLRNTGSVVYRPGSATISVSAIQQFIVNVSWDEYDPQAKAKLSKYITVSRYVRI